MTIRDGTIPQRYFYKKEASPGKVWNLGVSTILEMSYLEDTGGVAEVGTPVGEAFMDITPPRGLEVQSGDVAFDFAGTAFFSRDGVLFRGWNINTGATVQVGTVDPTGAVIFTQPPLASMGGTISNSVSWKNLAYNREGGLDILNGVFRVDVAPIKAGSFQLQEGPNIGSANSGGVLSGDFVGQVDFQRGLVWWTVADLGDDPLDGVAVQADQVTYNAVYLQFVPLSPALLGLNTVRLPLDGKVPIFHKGSLAVVHNTREFTVNSPVVRDTPYDLGRVRIAHVKVLDALGVVVPSTLYTRDLDAGTITFPTASNLSPYTLPFKALHRVEDLLTIGDADISGVIKFTSKLTHNFDADETYVSTALLHGDLFSRVENYFEQVSWNSVWSDTSNNTALSAQYNDVLHPIVVTNRGAITERWAIIFNNATQFRVVGEFSGQIAEGDINTLMAPNNPATGAPYFTIPVAGWGLGWAAGNVLRFNTKACGAPLWVARTILQGPYTFQSDRFEIAYRGNVNAE